MRATGGGRWFAGAILLAVLVRPIHAQDTTRALEQGVRVGITYTPGLRPGMLVMGSPGSVVLDSVRAILQRDLDYSDRFEMIFLPGAESLMVAMTAPAPRPPSGGAASSGVDGFVNYGLFEALGADYAVAIRAVPETAAVVTVFDVRGRQPRRAIPLRLDSVTGPESRLAIHRVSDEVVRAAAGAPGIAATRLLIIERDRAYRIDTDGADALPVSRAGVKAMSPVWAPDGRRVAYMEFAAGAGRVYVQNIASGERALVPPTAQHLNYALAFSPDGRTLAFTRSAEDGTHLFTYNLAENCCVQRLTADRFSDNLSPTFSPDGRRIAFSSNRPGTPQIYVMSADGTGQELFAPFDYGVTGSSHAPEWSPDGLNIAFHRDVAGIPQVFVMDVASRRVRQLTSAGRNEDPTWAPDGRHLAFVSTRTGSRQVWIIDLDTGRVRQLTRLGEARLPAWSPRIAEGTNP
ncbi:MAG: PD40 domain-containing protein [Gemmatimonadetes bacterium]|nr:PD40 domain-containing protein [Gemmatimonadota bacterium]